MSWTKVNQSTRSLLFTVAVITLAAFGLWVGAQFNTAEANTTASPNAVPAATFAANPASLGAIPDRGVDGCTDTDPAQSKDVTFTVSGLTGSVSNVQLQNLTFSPAHTWAADIKAILIAPNGASHTIFGRTGATTSTSCGDSSDLAGPYTFSDSAASPPSGGWWQAATAATGTAPIASGTYRTTGAGGAGATNPMPATSMNTSFAGVTNPNGTWTLRLTDHGGGDTGSVSAATLSIDTGAGVTNDANVDMNGDGRTDFVVARGTAVPLTEATAPTEMAVNRGAASIRERLANEGKFDAPESALAPPIYWYISINGSGQQGVAQLGDAATDFLTPEDFDGDGKDDIAVWRPGLPFNAAFYILQSSNNTVRTEVFGQTGDDPAVVGDYDGDGKADPAVYRCPAANTGDGQCYFFFRGSLNNPNGNITYVPWGFGETGDLFANPGDFDGDGKYDFCIQRTRPNTTSGGQFVLLKSSNLGVEYIDWGNNTDFILPGDYDGDGRSDFMVRRTVSGQRQHWLLTRTGATSVTTFGITGDLSAPGDYDGDGKQDIAIWRSSADPNQNFFWVLNSSNGTVTNFEWGQQNDVPAASWYVH